MTKLTEHFSLEELSCKCHRCNRGIPPPKILANLKRLAVVLEKFRIKIGNKPIHVNSGYRCLEHNAECPGSATHSFHMDGLAADIWWEGATDEQLFELAADIQTSQIPKAPAKTSLFKGVGYYEGQHFVHVDIATGKPRPNTWKK